ncbi:MAG: hypothetical protein DIU78_014990 [Pseudomonadota bacterium]
MKRAKRLTRKERKNLDPTRAERLRRNAPHIHCIACGRHIDPSEFTSLPPRAVELTCNHGTQFPSCADCQVTARYLIAEHDRLGSPVARAPAWH